LPKDSSGNSLVWTGKPWILPGVVGRTIFVLVAAVLVVWLEVALDVASATFLGLEVVLWTGLLFFSVWLFSLMHLVLLHASNDYILRSDSLEVRTGILATRSFVIVPSGFSDLEVDIPVSGRILNLGDIIVHSQSESNVLMVRVRDPVKVAERIREIMERPIVRIEADKSTSNK
jgi:membrane protein YdbS with pleckstrin-like domain